MEQRLQSAKYGLESAKSKREARLMPQQCVLASSFSFRILLSEFCTLHDSVLKEGCFRGGEDFSDGQSFRLKRNGYGSVRLWCLMCH